jgi:phosphohistidine swiveling domain-containing protein
MTTAERSPRPPRTGYVLPLGALGRNDRACAGTKAANLGDLVQANFPVPDGFVLTADAFGRFLAANRIGAESSAESIAAASLPPDLDDALLEAAARFGDAPLAVRSSGVNEDLPGASFAGQYATVLDVRGVGALADAVRQCWASAFDEPAAAYRAGRDQPAAAIAVLVQRLVQADAAGVAFTANPVTGDRTEVVISAVRGLGERLVSGQASPDEWSVRGTDSVCYRASEDAIGADDAHAVAELARRVEAHLGGVPQDIEWAMAGGKLFLLQARPITALPAQVEWTAPGPGGWARNFRIGEWLGDPVTPLFETWLLPRLDERFWANNARLIGAPRRPEPPYAVVNGWFFTSMSGWTDNPLGILWTLLRHPGVLRLASMMSSKRARRAAAPFVREWQEDTLPRYRSLVQRGESRVGALAPDELIDLIDEVADAAGDYFIWVALIGGTGWKTEVPLARFYREHIAPRIQGSHQRMLAGLTSSTPEPHAVLSLDWFHPTLGEAGPLAAAGDPGERHARLEGERLTAEAAARSALQSEPEHLKQFEDLLATAQYFAGLREQVVASFTLGWPVMRRALLRLGAHFHGRGLIAADEDVFFLTRDELLGIFSDGERAASHGATVTARRTRWQRQRRLVPPLVLGELPPMVAKAFVPLGDAVRSHEVDGEHGLRGLPASPGRATGRVRIIRGPEDFERLRPGEVLVAPATAPAWTPLFSRCAAVVTDTGSVLAHASLVAREFGIPAVVGTGDATARLSDGQVVTVDGSAGIVEVPPG